MIKQLGLSFALLITLGFYIGCRKSGSVKSAPSSADQLLIQNARLAFSKGLITPSTTAAGSSGTVRKQSTKTPLWDKAYTLAASKTTLVIVPLHYDQEIYFKTGLDPLSMYAIDNAARLVIYQDTGHIYHGEIVTLMPDSSFTSGKSFSGIILIEDWIGNNLSEYKYQSGTVQKLTKMPVVSDGSGIKHIDEVVLTVCYSMDEYNYSVDDPTNGVYSSEPLGCSTYFIDDGGSGGGGLSGSDYGGVGGGSGSASTVATSLVVSRGNNPIQNIKQYIQCFGNNPSATYNITLYVDQPSPGTPKSYTSSGPSSFGLTVGHAFMVFQENQGGATTRRSMGLYPAGSVTPLTPTSQGSLNDDEGHHFDISLTMTVSGSVFMSVIDAFANGNNVSYNLNSNNCVTWSLSSLAAGGINIHTKPGSWPFGSGDDPGNLGEDIRSMSLSANMSRSTVAGSAPANSGSCQ